MKDSGRRALGDGFTMFGDTPVATSWAISVRRTDVVQLARIRLFPGLQVLVVDDCVWVRGDSFNDLLDRQVRSISGAEFFFMAPSGLLFRRGESVPTRTLPDGEWRSFREWFVPRMPRAGFTRCVETAVDWKLVRDGVPRDANVLMVTWPVWREFVTTAPLVRLKHLIYAASDDGKALVRGTPMPSLPGQFYFEHNGIAVPAGWKLAPQVDADTLRDSWELAKDDFVLCKLDGSFSVIAEDQFVSVSRSSVRLTDQT